LSSPFVFHSEPFTSIDSAARADELSCDFRKPCCWHSLNDDSEWQIRSGRTININEFRRTFLVGRSRSPPAGNYLLQNDFKDLTSFGSCPFCSSDTSGNRLTRFRHWQSPTARLKLCWRRWGQAAIRAENCHPAEPSRQSQVISQKLVVPVGVDVQVNAVLISSRSAIMDR
uniref:MAM domain-containing protein n=1 Tax=Heligmosomoides polygyrus TaxID=6339 RepID=A0A183F4F2_HELPZ